MEDIEIFNKIEEKFTGGDFVSSGNEDGPPLRGLVLFYINVGSLPPYKAEAFIERYKEKTKPAFKSLEKWYKVLYLPIRGDCETRVEFMSIPAVSE